MFSNAEFIREWNEIFSFQISENDLAKPTETFVFTALVNYLGMFNFDTALMFEKNMSEVSRERRAFLVQFCSYIDRMYKISDKACQFTFWDLVNPPPKKITHMLNYLLNYLFYYNMFKETVIPKAASKLAQHKEILERVVDCERGIGESAMQAKKIAERMGEYREIIPETSTKLNNLRQEDVAMKKNIRSYKQQLQENKKLLDNLRNRRVSLMADIVDKDEVEQKLKIKQSLEEQIADTENKMRNIYDHTKDCHNQTLKLQKYKNDINNVMTLKLLEKVKDRKTCHKKLEELTAKLETITAQRTQRLEVQSKLTEHMAGLQDRLHEQVNVCLPNLRSTGEKFVEDLNKYIYERKKMWDDQLTDELANVNNDLEKEIGLSNVISTRCTELVKCLKY